MKTLIKAIAITAALGLAFFAFREQLASLPGQLADVDLRFLVLAGVGLVIYQIWNAGVWSEVLGAMGFQASRLECTRIWLSSECMKWLPGSVWSYGSRIVSGQSLGLNKKQVSASIAYELILTNLAWGALAVTLFFNGQITSLLADQIETLKAYLWVPVLGLLGFAVLAYLFRASVTAKLLEVLNLRGVSLLKSARTVFHYIVLSFFNAALFWAVIKAIPGLEVHFSVVVALSGVAWLAGFWAIGIPGGLGVREAVITLILSQFGSLEAAILAAILWRVMQMGAEMLALLISLASGLRHRRVFQRSRTGNDHEEAISTR